MNIETKYKRIRYILLSIIILSLLLVISFMKFPDYFKSRLDYDIFKLTYQFLLLVVIGGAISFLFTWYVKLREERTKQNEQIAVKRKEEKFLQRKFYNDFAQAYNDGKKIRRFLRARTRKLSTDDQEQEVILLKTRRYDQLMRELTILQLKFEFFCDEVGSNPELFSGGDVQSLSENLKKIEEYLNSIVSEYENCYHSYPNQSFIDEVPYIPLYNLDKLREFINKYKEATCFKHQFKMAADKVAEILVAVLTSP